MEMVANGEALLERTDELLRTYERTGDERAFSQLVQNYRGMVFGVCLRVMRNTHDAEDATQAVFLTLALQARGGNNIRMLTPWLQQVAQRVSLDMYKSRKRRLAREDIRRQQTLDRFEPDESRQLDQDELRETLRLQLNELPAKYRLPMILYYFGGLAPEAIAKELGCKKKTLGVRLFRARKMLAEQLASRGVVACGAPLLLALRDVMHQGLFQSLPASGAHYIGVGASAGLGLGFDHLSSTVAAMASAFARFATGSKLRLTLLLLIAAGSGVAGSAGLIRDFTRLKPLNLIQTRMDSIDELLQSLPRVFSPQMLTIAIEPSTQQSSSPLEVSIAPRAMSDHPIHPHLSPVVAPQQLPAPAQVVVASAPAAARGGSVTRTDDRVVLPPPVTRKTTVPVVTSLMGSNSSAAPKSRAVSAPPELARIDQPKETALPDSLPDQPGVVFGESLCTDDELLSVDVVQLGYTASYIHGSWSSIRNSSTGALVSYDDGVPIPFVPTTIHASDTGIIPEPSVLALIAVASGLMLPRHRRGSGNC
jgi:RNA polymerase sigma factor (sigma-70 family)